MSALHSPATRVDIDAGEDALGFLRPLAAGGYAWWYIDALSDDGEWALAAIFFIGSVFSPAYAARVRRGERARPEEHLAVNLAIYRRGAPALWVMSEYGERGLRERSARALGIAGSSLVREGDGLRVELVERAAPFMAALAGVGGRVEGRLQLVPECAELPSVGLGGTHEWRVPMPRARVRVQLTRPAISFAGTAYHDVNRGDERLEARFRRWSWARFHDRGRVVVLYDLEEREGAERTLLVDAHDAAPARARAPRLVPTEARGAGRALGLGGWGLTLPEMAAAGKRALPEAPLMAAPFYARYRAALHEAGRAPLVGVGEHLDLDRFRRAGLQLLLRFKTRRVTR